MMLKLVLNLLSEQSGHERKPKIFPQMLYLSEQSGHKRKLKTKTPPEKGLDCLTT